MRCLTTFLLLIPPIKTKPSHQFLDSPDNMAQVSSIMKNASVLAVVALSAAAAVSAQATAPATPPDAGSALSIPISGVVIGSSMLLSFVALFRN
ncbi:hypothetical protein L1987_64234 [Smallanthus sonchifolius]|uniref:Uncharacterized protein n=1 Tax=Smallanthus sonchifolius TaxID=185202 RepID=A0ACB9CFF9_9ASTR|nr:hypothetical protein L1987_64234 [Smallanthus sonchifolius]